MRIIHHRQERVLTGCRLFSADKDPASEHDVSEQAQALFNRDNMRDWLAQAMQKVISGPADFQAAKVAVLTLVSMNERAWIRAYGEDERDLMIRYCEVQL